MTSIPRPLLAATLLAAAASAQITPGNLIVLRVGDGSGALTNASTAVFYDEYTPAGALVQTIPLPIAASGSNQPCTNSGTATSEGHLNVSADGRYLISAGYGSVPGVASIVSTASSVVPRVIARVDLNGTIDTSTALDSVYSGNNIRSATSLDGTQFWTAGTGSSPNNGVHYATLGATTSLAVNSPNAPTNTRTVTITDGQLYCSSATGTYQGISVVGTGLPTTGGQVVTLLNGFPTASGPSPYDHYFADADTLYVADDRTNGNGGIQKWTQSGGTWSLQYTLAPSATTGCRGVTGSVTAGTATLFATTTNNLIVTVTDTGAGSAVGTLVTGATNTAFRGIRLVRTSGSAVRQAHGCGPTTITVTGLPALGNTIRTELGAITGAPFIGLGFGVTPRPFCGCTVGHTWTSAGFGGVSTLRVPNDMIFAGAVFGIQGADFLGTGGCPDPLLTFTDTIVITLGN